MLLRAIKINHHHLITSCNKYHEIQIPSPPLWSVSDHVISDLGMQFPLGNRKNSGIE